MDIASDETERDDLIRRLVFAQDLSLIDRPAGSAASPQEIVSTCLVSAICQTINEPGGISPDLLVS